VDAVTSATTALLSQLDVRAAGRAAS